MSYEETRPHLLTTERSILDLSSFSLVMDKPMFMAQVDAGMLPHMYYRRCAIFFHL